MKLILAVKIESVNDDFELRPTSKLTFYNDFLQQPAQLIE